MRVPRYDTLALRATYRKSSLNASSSMSEALRTFICRTYWPLPPEAFDAPNNDWPGQ